MLATEILALVSSEIGGLDLARVESGTMTLSMEPVALGELLRESQAMVEPLGNQRGIRMMFPKNADFHVQADRTRLKQIVLNLLSNAIKYNRDMGAMVLDCASTSNGRVRISVQDTGRGLTPDQLDNLFQPFNRLGQEAGSEEGTGIGLVVTKRLVELMGGEIGVNSSPGIGSLFWIELQMAEPVILAIADAHAPVVAVATPAPDPDALPILLYVEDNPANLRLVEEVLHFRSDLRMISAQNGRDGLALAKSSLPHVILMDMNLPDINGSEAHQRLRADPATAGIPVIALTANAMARDIKAALAAGFYRYLTKPIQIDELTEAIDSALAFARTGRGAP